MPADGPRRWRAGAMRASSMSDSHVEVTMGRVYVLSSFVGARFLAPWHA